MPIHLTIDHDKRYVEFRVEGEAGLKEVEDVTDAVIAANALGYRKLWDGRKAIAVYNDQDVMMLGARAAAYATLGGRGALAIIANGVDNFELAKRFINLAKPGRPVQVFLDEADARLWLMEQSES